jgi:hypothetical protein
MKGGRQSRFELKRRNGFTHIALWQVLAFVMLILLIWVNELLDLPWLLFGVERQPASLIRGCVATAGVLVAAVVAIGNTYLQQRNIVSGLLTICSYCKKIRVQDELWQRVEDYIGRRSTIDFTHSVCPECFQRVKRMVEEETDDAIDNHVR